MIIRNEARAASSVKKKCKASNLNMSAYIAHGTEESLGATVENTGPHSTAESKSLLGQESVRIQNK